MSNRLKLIVLGLVALAVALAFSSWQGVHAQDAREQAVHRTIYPNGGSDGPL